MKGNSAPLFLRLGLLMLALIVLATLVAAQDNTVGKTRDLTLREPARAGDVVLPAGSYWVTHVMEGERHIMLFKAMRGEKKEYRISCKMQALPSQAARSEQRFEETPTGTRQLTSLVFAGDKVEHVF
ncbi:MAG: hypothetical protein LAN37_05330 [Acidobacteriia bacterium]|nr:hypothetical protein [Terriglobia bacterium]